VLITAKKYQKYLQNDSTNEIVYLLSLVSDNDDFSAEAR